MEITEYLPLSQNNSELVATETLHLVEMLEIDVRDSKQRKLSFFQKTRKYISMRFVSACIK